MTRVVKWWLLCCMWIVNNSSTACTPYLLCVIGCLAVLSTKAAGQLVSSAVEESELAWLGRWGPSYMVGLAPSPRELQPPAEPLSPVNCYPTSLRRACCMRETNCPGQHVPGYGKMFMPLFAQFYLVTAAAAR